MNTYRPGLARLRRLLPTLALSLTWLPVVGTSLQAQGVQGQLAKTFALDFTVPETPAFNLLSVEESSILRPGTIRELSLSASEFTGSEPFLPRAFAVEFAPALLIGGSTLTRAEYERKAPLYRTRISAATRRFENDESATHLALGIRTTLYDGADLRANGDTKDYFDFVTAITRALVDDKQAVEDEVLRRADSDASDEISDALDSLFAGTGTVADLVDAAGMEEADVASATAAITALMATLTLTQDHEAAIAAKRTSLQQKNWNAHVVEIAYAVRAEAADSTGKDISVDRHAVWLTWGVPVGSWGQVLLGVQGGVARDTLTNDFDGAGSLGARLYMGANYLKFFVEVEGDFQTGRTGELLVNSGGEIRPGIGGWVSFSAGLKRNHVTKEYDLVSHLQWSFPFERLGGL